MEDDGLDLAVGEAVRIMGIKGVGIIEPGEPFPFLVKEEIERSFVAECIKRLEAFVKGEDVVKRIVFDDRRVECHDPRVERFSFEGETLLQFIEQILFNAAAEFFFERYLGGRCSGKASFDAGKIFNRCFDDHVRIKKDDVLPLFEERRKEVELVEDDGRMLVADAVSYRQSLASVDQDPFFLEPCEFSFGDIFMRQEQEIPLPPSVPICRRKELLRLRNEVLVGKGYEDGIVHRLSFFPQVCGTNGGRRI